MPAYKDSERKTWDALFYYTDWTGKRKRKHKRGFKQKKDAKKFEDDFLTKVSRSPDMTFSSLVALYREDMAGRLKQTTIQSKDWMLEAHIIPFFGELPINEITPAHIRKWQSGLMGNEKKYAPTYLKTINNQLTAVLNYAVRFYGLPSNPCHVAGSMGRKNADAMKFWTHDQFEQFLEHVEKPSARVGFLLLFWTGIRIGELLALDEFDFNFDNGTVSISKNFQVLNGEPVVWEPKTTKSKRTTHVPAAILQTVQDYIKCLYDYTPGDRLFPFTKHYFQKSLRRTCDAAEMDYIRLHDLRHSHASLLIEMGVPIILVSERLGHDDIQTTLRTYGHLYPSRHEETVQKLDEMIAKAAEKSGAEK